MRNLALKYLLPFVAGVSVAALSTSFASATNTFGMLAGMTYDERPLQCGELLGAAGRIHLPAKGDRKYCLIGDVSYVATRDEAGTIRITTWWNIY